MNGGIRLGKIAGIDISLDYSWFLIFALITFGLSVTVFPGLVPGFSTAAYIAMALATSLLFFGSVLFHELMHSLVAKHYGMRIEGIRLMLFGGVSQLEDEPRTPGVEFQMAFAGPLSSLVLGAGFLGIFFGLGASLPPYISQPAFWLGSINVLLGIFNLLPGFPLDGGRVLRSAIWQITGNLKRATGIAAAFGKGLAYMMILAGVVGPFIGNASLIWFILLGWYLVRAADSSYQQVILEEALQGITVKDAMTRDPETVSPDLNINEMVTEHFMKHNWIAYPVVEGSHVEGMITINNLEELPRRSWNRKRVRDIMKPVSSEIVAEPEEELTEVLPKMNGGTGGRLLVVRDDHLLGILTRNDIGNAIRRRMKAQEEKERKEEERRAA